MLLRFFLIGVLLCLMQASLIFPVLEKLLSKIAFFPSLLLSKIYNELGILFEEVTKSCD